MLKETEAVAVTIPRQNLVIGALGIVYGDIGTSPLYTVRLCAHALGGVSNQAIFGILSLITWSLVIVVCCKYLIVIMRADNCGEGGILALTALALRVARHNSRLHWLILVAGLLGAALFYGDGVITPAISVLSAVEGINVATPDFSAFIVPLTLAILVMLFAVQHVGTAKIGKYAGLLTTSWFIAIGFFGALELLRQPYILCALSPTYGLRLIIENPGRGFALLGAVVLAVTGAEALYADMGQFGKRPIRIAWVSLVFPAVLLSYFGQGALLLQNHAAIHNPFYLLVPRWGLYPMVILATVATVIAAQAIISGAFSMTQQAMILGYLPRFEIKHTSEQKIGQIYLPAINFFMMLAVAAVVLMFRNSNNLGAAYGIAVTGTMLLTTLLAFVYAVGGAGWNIWFAVPVFGIFLIIDLVLFTANTTKIVAGGWFPAIVAAFIFTLMMTWLRGNEALDAARWREAVPLEGFLKTLQPDQPLRVAGTAIFMVGNDLLVPPALLDNLEHNHILHERVMLMKIVTHDIPHISDALRLSITNLDHNFHVVEVNFGFMDEPNIPRTLALIRVSQFAFILKETSFFVGHAKLVLASPKGFWSWRKRLFIFMHLVMLTATEFYDIPINRVIQMGGEIEI